MDCSPPGSSVHGILQVRMLEWVAMPFSRGSSQLRDQTHVFCGSYTAGGFFYHWSTRDRTCHKHHRQFQSGEEKLGSSGHLGDRCTPNPEITLLACSCRAPPLQGGDLLLLWTPFGPFHENWPLKNLQVNTVSLDSARGELLSLKACLRKWRLPVEKQLVLSCLVFPNTRYQ